MGAEIKRFGYARVSTVGQNEDRQVLDLLNFGIPERDIFVDKQSGRSFERTKYLVLRDQMLRKGDILVVKSIDRFGRNYSGIRTEWEYITKTIGADIEVLDTPMLNTTRDKELLGTVIGCQAGHHNRHGCRATGIATNVVGSVGFVLPSFVELIVVNYTGCAACARENDAIIG